MSSDFRCVYSAVEKLGCGPGVCPLRCCISSSAIKLVMIFLRTFFSSSARRRYNNIDALDLNASYIVCRVNYASPSETVAVLSR